MKNFFPLIFLMILWLPLSAARATDQQCNDAGLAASGLSDFGCRRLTATNLRTSWVHLESGDRFCRDQGRDINWFCVRPRDCGALGAAYTCQPSSNNNNCCRLFHCNRDSGNICCRPRAANEQKNFNVPRDSSGLIDDCFVPETTPNQPPPDLPVQPPTTPQEPPPPSVVITVADCCRQIVPTSRTGDYGLNHLVQVAINIYECILCLVGALILAMLIAGAIMMLISAGNETRVATGKRIIAAAVVGGIIVFASFLIVNFTVKALGASFSNEQKVEIKPQG